MYLMAGSKHLINVHTYANFIGITVQFSLNKYEVKENNGPAQPELTLSRPLEYSTFAVLIKVEDVTATGT